MHLSSSVLSLARRLIPSVFGISRQGVRIEAGSYPDLSTDCMVQVGEDACFVASPATAATGHQVIGVADGVGGWKSEGIDSAFFSRALMECCRNVVTKKKVDLDEAEKIMSRGYKDLMWLHSHSHGSSTACILSFNCNTGLLQTANLGDSGFLAIRNGAIIGESMDTVHYFNCPFQLSNAPPGYDRVSRVISDSPYASHVTQVALREGDLLVAATDGLFSNMYNHDIISHLQELKDLTPRSIQRATEDLVEAAYRLSLDQDYLSPFAREGTQALSWPYSGGKPDDITVVLAAVVSDDGGT